LIRWLRAATAAGLMFLPLAVLAPPAHADEACPVLDPTCVIDDTSDTAGDVADPVGTVEDTVGGGQDTVDDTAGTVEDTADDTVNTVSDTVDDVLKTANPDPGGDPGPGPDPGPGGGNDGGGDPGNHGSGGNHDGDANHGNGGTGGTRDRNGSLGRGSIPSLRLAAFRGDPAAPRAGAGSDPTIRIQPPANTQPTGTSIGQAAIRVAGGLVMMALLLGLVGGFVFVQNRLDRRDPKLVPASLGSDRVEFA
jgi:hypothetical protein